MRLLASAVQTVLGRSAGVGLDAARLHAHAPAASLARNETTTVRWRVREETGARTDWIWKLEIGHLFLRRTVNERRRSARESRTPMDDKKPALAAGGGQSPAQSGLSKLASETFVSALVTLAVPVTVSLLAQSSRAEKVRPHVPPVFFAGDQP